jgi:arsenate reductase
MAEGFLKAFDENIDVYSAGTEPSSSVHPKAIEVMDEMHVDLRNNYPKSVDEFLDQEFDYVITVCGGAKESCPMFTGKVKNRFHIGFQDPAEATGTEDEITDEFRFIRDEIQKDFFAFYTSNIKQK